MFARVATYHGTPGRVKEATRVVDEVTPDLQKMEGFQRAYIFVDDKSGKTIAWSLWGTEEQTNRSTAPAGTVRDKIGQAIGAKDKPTVEIFEVGAEVGAHGPGSKFARVSEYHGMPGKIDEGIRSAQAIEADLKRMPGFHQLFLFADRKTGKAMTLAMWDSEDAMNQSSSGVNPLRERVSKSLGFSGKPTVEVYEIAGEVPQRMRRAA